MFSFFYHCQDFYWTWLYTRVTQRELLTVRWHMSSPLVFYSEVRVAHIFSFLFMSYYVSLRSVHFISSCLQKDSSHIYVICGCMRIVVSNTYFFFVLCTLWCQCLWIVHFWLHLRYSLTFNFQNKDTTRGSSVMNEIEEDRLVHLA